MTFAWLVLSPAIRTLRAGSLLSQSSTFTTEKEIAMTQEQFDTRSERAGKELFVISTTEEGWRVRSAHNPSRYYLVSGDGEGLRCTCPDFETHFPEDPGWACKHILAVQDYQAKVGVTHPQGDEHSSEERATIQAEGSREVRPGNGNSAPAQMVIKRSISPDGRIDSISIEFSSAVDETTVAQIKNRALKTLKLQTEIVRNFLNGPNGKASSTPAKTNGAVAARLLDVGVANGQYGDRFYLNVEVNGRRARFFGTTGQIARAISAAGEKLLAKNVAPGLRVDLPCRVITQESADGRYLNVTQVLPSQYQKGGTA